MSLSVAFEVVMEGLDRLVRMSVLPFPEEMHELTECWNSVPSVLLDEE